MKASPQLQKLDTIQAWVQLAGLAALLQLRGALRVQAEW
jgi:hypothetical protein